MSFSRNPIYGKKDKGRNKKNTSSQEFRDTDVAVTSKESPYDIDAIDNLDNFFYADIRKYVLLVRQIETGASIIDDSIKVVEVELVSIALCKNNRISKKAFKSIIWQMDSIKNNLRTLNCIYHALVELSSSQRKLHMIMFNINEKWNMLKGFYKDIILLNKEAAGFSLTCLPLYGCLQPSKK